MDDDLNLFDYALTQKGWDTLVIPTISDFCHGMNIHDIAEMNGTEVDTIRTCMIVLLTGYANAYGMTFSKLYQEKK